jgi:hypothetical protein
MSNDVFEVIDGEILINDFNKMIPEFRILTTKEDLLYVYHMGSYRSPYSNYDSDIKKQKVINDFCPDLTISIHHQQAIDKFIELQETPSMRFYLANEKAMKNLTDFLNEVDIRIMDDKGKPIYKPYDLTNAMKESGKIIEAHKTLKEQVMKESVVSNTIRGGYVPNKWEE